MLFQFFFSRFFFLNVAERSALAKAARQDLDRLLLKDDDSSEYDASAEILLEPEARPSEEFVTTRIKVFLLLYQFDCFVSTTTLVAVTSFAPLSLLVTAAVG